jgi:ribosomal protein S18 acetylase RimI-like enzyme
VRLCDVPMRDPVRNTVLVTAVRLGSDSDGPALARIDLATWTPAVSPAPAPVDANSYQFFTDRTVPGNVLVAEVDGDVAGWVKVQSPTPLLSHAHVLEIGGLAVDPTRQGAGVGLRLVEAAVQECGRRGARKVTLRVLGPNTAARRLYERCGFITEGVLHEEFMLQGRYVDDVLMARQLVVPVP